jgi:2,4-diketo-3-deoxy-L-fuconate hydrolase
LKLATFKIKGEERAGAVVGNAVIDLLNAHVAESRSSKATASKETFGSIRDLLDAGAKGLSAAKKAQAYAIKRLGDPIKADGKLAHQVSKVRLCAPITNPRKLLALAGNYAAHIMEGGGQLAAQDKETPRVFMMPPSTCITGPKEPIIITKISKTVDYEGELCIVMGRKAKGINKKDAKKYIAGFTILNDVSERRLVIRKRSEDRPQDTWFDWLNGKWLDSFAPIGPVITTFDEIGDPHNLNFQTRVNGEIRQDANTNQMIFHYGEIVEYISAIVTLEPGDLISTGTAAGVGHTTKRFLKPGDKVEVEIDKIGILENTCKAGK